MNENRYTLNKEVSTQSADNTVEVRLLQHNCDCDNPAQAGSVKDARGRRFTAAGRYGLIDKIACTDRDYAFQLTEHTEMNPVKLVITLTEVEPLVESAYQLAALGGQFAQSAYGGMGK